MTLRYFKGILTSRPGLTVTMLVLILNATMYVTRNLFDYSRFHAQLLNEEMQMAEREQTREEIFKRLYVDLLFIYQLEYSRVSLKEGGKALLLGSVL